MGSISRDAYERILLIKREMERLIREFSGQTIDIPDDSNSVSAPVDIFEVNNEIIVQVDLPGLKEGDIKVFVSRNRLFIEGVKPESTKPERANYILMERPYGNLRRVIELPHACNTSTIVAEYNRGILSLKLKRIEERRGEKREIKIKFEE